MTRRLLILDLNGTILHRLTHVKESIQFRNHPVVIEKNLKPNITIHGCKIVYRPFAKDFLDHILKHFDVAVWTSSQPKNALPMVHYSFEGLLDFSLILDEAKRRQITIRQLLLGPSEKVAELLKDRLLEETEGLDKLQFVWTQDECDTIKPPLPSSPSLDSDNSSSTFIKPIRKKNLTKIYDSFPYTPLNTLIIDDTDEKLVDHSNNHLKVDEFNVLKSETDFTKDNELVKL